MDVLRTRLRNGSLSAANAAPPQNWPGSIAACYGQHHIMESQVPEGKATAATTAPSGGSPMHLGSQLGAQLGGARADFVGELGRKVNDARALLTTLEAEPGHPTARDELRRKLLVLGNGARLMSFDVMARTLAEADAIFECAVEGALLPAGLADLAQLLDDLPALAWDEAPVVRDRSEQDVAPGPLLRSALVFGAAMLAEAMIDESYGGAPYDCERTEDVEAALGLARSLAPDVVVVDGDLEGALTLVQTLLEDPLTEPVPILVVGSFGDGQAPGSKASVYVALGVAKTITKPISPESLRQTAEEAIAQREGRTIRVALGEPTLEQLGERLADEVRQALVGSVSATARECRVPLGEGTEVLGAIWGAIARVREVVTARTDGAVRFASRGPEGAIALAPWLQPDVARGDREHARGRGPAADVKLTGRRVVVADDDPGVTWFIADLLKTAGCRVFEALDGRTALELAYTHSPDLVVSDILMPELDGFALCRALKRDVALRDVPVVLLSWKEDLLQRVRELGASAAAYLRKESDSRAIVARVREVLRPRTRIEARLRADGEVRGRLDGLTVHSLLKLVCALRPNSRISVRDASFLYEMEVRFGAPQRATRTAGDGSFQRGAPVIAAMLGVGAGRFTVAESMSPIRGELEGGLADQLTQPLANARGALHSVTGARIMIAERIRLDEAVVEAYLRATPEPARGLITQIAAGASPRTVLLGGNVDPALLEDVLSDLASRGAISGVLGANDRDLLAPAIAHAMAILRGDPRPSPSIPAAQTPSDAAPAPSLPRVPRSPSSLADAVMREVGNRSSPTGRANPISSTPPPLIEPARLRTRVSSAPPPPRDLTSSIPPDAIVPSNSSGHTEAADPASSGPQISASNADERTDIDGTDYSANDEPSIPISMETSKPLPVVSEEGRTAPSKARQKAEKDAERTPLASVAVAESPKPQRQLWQYGAILAGAGAVVWVALQMSGPAASPGTPAWSAGATAQARGATAEPDRAHPASAASRAEPGVTFADIAPGVDVPPGQGVLEVTGPLTAEVRVDDVARGHGPRVSVTLVAGSHEVKVGADKKSRVLEVRAGRTTRFEVSQVP